MRTSKHWALWCRWLAVVCVACGCESNSGGTGGVASSGKERDGGGAANKKVDLDALRPQVQAFCGDCHTVPPASSSPKEEWPQQVALGYELYQLSGRSDLKVPRQASVIAYYQALAPDKLDFATPALASHPLPVRFRQQVIKRPPDAKMAAVAALMWQAPDKSTPGKLFFSDMHLGDVSEIRFAGAEPKLTTLANLGHPAIIEQADLDADGIADYLVGDLGTFLPEDHEKGRVLWLHPDRVGGWATEVLAEGLGRVAQAVSGDFDGDQDLDILVAEFGWRTTGRILLLRRDGDEAGVPRYEQVVVDPRHGTSNVRTIDWDGDGDLDFVALITQEHEKVELFLNEGDGRFRIETIFAAGDPAFGSGDIEVVDLDGDGDLDVLHTNGDAMDTGMLKPFHAVRWLENDGHFPFTPHVITPLPGAFKAVAADFDGDGDLDVVAFAFPPISAGDKKIPSFDELVFLEQTERGQFARHSLDAPAGGVALAAADFDGDGDIDLATGAFNEGPDTAWVTIWWNEGRARATPSAAR